jgi:hypothetical protein
MTALAELLAAEFVDGEVLQFTGRGGKEFDYIEATSVMDRLDEVLGIGAWSVTVEPISVAEGIVKVRLSGTTPEDQSFVYEDFGYANNVGGDALKEAVSDGIRRCGRYLGVARYLYRKHDSPAARAPARPVAATAPVLPHRPVAVANPYAKTHDDPYPEQLAEIDGPFLPIGGTVNTTDCTVHGVPWQGTSGDLYHGPKPYCRHPQNTPKARR